MSTTITTTKNTPLAITQEIVDIMLDADTLWINEMWDGTTETMRDGINAGNYKHYPFMLYGGNRAQRHELHKKLASNFSHSSIDMDDGSRVMIIVNNPGYIYKLNDFAVCFFVRRFWAKPSPDDVMPYINWVVHTSLDEMPCRKTVTLCHPHSENTAKTLNTWREMSRISIHETLKLMTDAHDLHDNERKAAEGLISLSESTPDSAPADSVDNEQYKLEPSVATPMKIKQVSQSPLNAGASTFAPRNAVTKRTSFDEPEMRKRQKTERNKGYSPSHAELVREFIGNPSIPDDKGPALSAQHTIDPSLKMAIMIIATDFNGAIALAQQSNQPIPINSIEGCVLNGNWKKAAKLSLHKIIDANMAAISIYRKQTQHSPSLSSEQSYERGAEAHMGYSPREQSLSPPY